MRNFFGAEGSDPERVQRYFTNHKECAQFSTLSLSQFFLSSFTLIFYYCSLSIFLFIKEIKQKHYNRIEIKTLAFIFYLLHRNLIINFYQATNNKELSFDVNRWNAIKNSDFLNKFLCFNERALCTGRWVEKTNFSLNNETHFEPLFVRRK